MIEYLYAIAVLPERTIHKIGYGRDPWKRFTNIQIGNHFQLDIAFICEPNVPAHEAEKYLHREWRHRLIRGEWYRVPSSVVLAAFTQFGSVTECPKALPMNLLRMHKVMQAHPRYT